MFKKLNNKNYIFLYYDETNLYIYLESEKTDEDRQKEEELTAELIDIVDQRNSIIDSIEMDRRRYISCFYTSIIYMSILNLERCSSYFNYYFINMIKLVKEYPVLYLAWF